MQFSDSIFFWRNFLIATSHKKDEAIRPALRDKFQADIPVPDGLDTHMSGTFSSKIERANSPHDAARRKSEVTTITFYASLVVASEGSYWPHLFLLLSTNLLLATYGSFFIETDIRAINNPTRMSVIAQAAENCLPS